MAKIDIDLALPMDGVYRESKKIYRPDSCQDCPMFLDEHVPWCVYYHRRSEVSTKPDWCNVIAITISEDL